MTARSPHRESIHPARMWGVGVLVCAALGRSGVAKAAEPVSTASPAPARATLERRSAERWYGYQTLLADAGALAVLIAGVATDDRGTGQGIQVVAGITFALGGPIVHLAHARPGASLASLGLRLGLPLAGALAGMGLAALAPDDDGDEYVVGSALGLLGGVAGAVALDATLVAREPEAVVAFPVSRWRPALVLGRGGLQLGLARAF